MGLGVVEIWRRFIRAVAGMPPAQGAPPVYLYQSSYRATIAAVSPDGSTVDVIPEAPWIPKQSGVKVLWGLPAFSTVIRPGAIVRVLFSAGDPTKSYAALFEGGEGLASAWKVNGDLNLQHLLSSQAGGSPSSSDAVHTTIDGTSTDRCGLITLGSPAPFPAGNISVDITYARPYPNWSRAWLQPADATAAGLVASPTGSTTPGIMVVYVDSGSTNGSKFRIASAIGSGATKVAGGSFYFFSEGG